MSEYKEVQVKVEVVLTLRVPNDDIDVLLTPDMNDLVHEVVNEMTYAFDHDFIHDSYIRDYEVL